MTQPLAVEVRDLVRSFGRTDAVNGLNLSVSAGQCFGLFGRNGAGKSTTIRCMLNHLKPRSGTIQVFGVSPQRRETEVKSHIGYVPEQVAFHPWMSARQVLDYAASFRKSWNRDLEHDLLRRFDIDEKKKTAAMSKGMRSQLALLCAICADPDLLLLDEPTSGLDPIVRREFLQTVIGAYLEGEPHRRTVFVSTHLISEWEGLIDAFTIIDNGRDIVSLESEEARARFRRYRLRFADAPPSSIAAPGVVSAKLGEREAEIVSSAPEDELQSYFATLGAQSIDQENLSLEEIFIAAATAAKGSRT